MKRGWTEPVRRVGSSSDGLSSPLAPDVAVDAGTQMTATGRTVVLVVVGAVETEDQQAEHEDEEEAEDRQDQGDGLDGSAHPSESTPLAAQALDVGGSWRPLHDGVGSSGISCHHVGGHRVEGRTGWRHGLAVVSWHRLPVVRWHRGVGRTWRRVGRALWRPAIRVSHSDWLSICLSARAYILAGCTLVGSFFLL